jgi:hypothetical protein
MGAVPLPGFHADGSAQFVSNVGGWMLTVGAQELMLMLTTSAALVALYGEMPLTRLTSSSSSLSAHGRNTYGSMSKSRATTSSDSIRFEP